MHTLGERVRCLAAYLQQQQLQVLALDTYTLTCWVLSFHNRSLRLTRLSACKVSWLGGGAYERHSLPALTLLTAACGLSSSRPSHLPANCHLPPAACQVGLSADDTKCSTRVKCALLQAACSQWSTKVRRNECRKCKNFKAARNRHKRISSKMRIIYFL